MTNLTKATLFVTGLLGVSAFLDNETFVIAKIVLLIGALPLIYFSTSGNLISKSFQIVIKDVRENRRDEYRNKLLNNLKSLGKPDKSQENYGEVGVHIEGKIKPEDIFKQIKKGNIKAQLNQTLVSFKYTSLEAAAEAVITINATATPNSELKIEGFFETIKVGGSGSVSVKIPKSLYKKNVERGFIPAVCIKGKLRDEIKIAL
ncbi:MAG: hypothetical protein U9R42_05360 [Bacteroidota bacterium]|nr:hypothetical protein [Bacteroidota bacterium]